MRYLAGAKGMADAETPPKQRMSGWRGDLQTAVSSTPANDWAGLSQEQEALLGSLQVPAFPHRLCIPFRYTTWACLELKPTILAPACSSQTEGISFMLLAPTVYLKSQERGCTLVQGGAVARRLPILQIQHGPSASDSIGMPVAAWLLGECLLHWAVRWRAPEVGPCTLKSSTVPCLNLLKQGGEALAEPGIPKVRKRSLQVDTAALRLRDSILTSAETEGLTYQAYWLSTTLALGAFLKARPLAGTPGSLLQHEPASVLGLTTKDYA